MKKLKKLLCGALLALLVLSVYGMPLIPDSIVEVQAATVKVATPKLVSAKASGTSKVKFTWKKVNGANGYRIYRKTDKTKWKAIKTIANGNTVSFNDSKLKPGTRYYYSVSAYKSVNGKNVYGKYNTKGIYAITGLATPKLTSLNWDVDFGTVDFCWNPVPGAHGYEILRKTANTSWKKIATETTNYYFEFPTQKGKYFYTVRAYCELSDKTIRSGYNKTGLECYVKSIPQPEPDLDPDETEYWATEKLVALAALGVDASARKYYNFQGEVQLIQCEEGMDGHIYIKYKLGIYSCWAECWLTDDIHYVGIYSSYIPNEMALDVCTYIEHYTPEHEVRRTFNTAKVMNEKIRLKNENAYSIVG